MVTPRLDSRSSPAGGGVLTDEAPRALHSHHYHAALLRTLREVDRVDSRAILEQTAAEFAFHGLRERWAPDADVAARLREVSEEFRESGLGRLELVGVSAKGGEIRVVSSHFAAGWKERYGQSKKPVCDVTAGFLGGALAATFGRSFTVMETECSSLGAPFCRFRAAPADGVLPASGERYPVSSPLPDADGDPTWLGEEEVAAALFESPLVADADGRIEGLGGTLTRLWPDFYAKVSQRFEEEVPRAMGAKFSNLPSLLFTEASHLHAFHFLGGVFQSPEWTERVAPRLRSREEWVHAAVSLVSLLGWGVWRVHTLLPGQRLTVRVYDSHEAVGHRRHFGVADVPRCYLARGVVAALMNLLYVGDPFRGQELTSSTYNHLFRSPTSFRAVETRCRAQDDSYCELVANPLSSFYLR